MRRKIWILWCFLIFDSSICLSEELPANRWYLEVYAPLWSENVKANLEKIISMYDTNIHDHTDTDGVEIVDSRNWLTGSIDNWLAEDWISSDVTSFEYDLLNSATATFKLKWKDNYKDGSVEYSCSWYLADRKNNRWVFTQFAEIDCGAHGL